MRGISTLLLLAGAGTTGGAVVWWANFYGDLIRGTKYTLGDAFPCLINNSGVCSLISGVSQLIGKTPYEPAVLWLGIAMLVMGLFAGVTARR